MACLLVHKQSKIKYSLRLRIFSHHKEVICFETKKTPEYSSGHRRDDLDSIRVNTMEHLQSIFANLSQDGYVFIKGSGQKELHFILEKLGHIIYTTDVKVDLSSRSLVTSAKALDYHTDHPRADYIAWLCIEQSRYGGETILADAEVAYRRLTQQEREVLAGIFLFEHKVFSGDKDSHPLVTIRDGNINFYYSYWLVEKSLSLEKKSALDKFKTYVSESKVAEIKLQRDDVLIVNNRKILHGRRSIGDKKRFLKRYWIGTELYSRAL